MTVSALLVLLVTVIKVVQGCSYKEAVGIAEELFAELRDVCRNCCEGTSCGEDEPDAGEAG